MKLTVAFFLLSLMAGCASVATLPRPADSYTSNTNAANDEPLFSASGGSIVEQDIERILNYQLKLPQKNRIAILKLSSDDYWQFYSSDFTLLSEKSARTFVGELRSSPRVYDASFLPSLLLPEKRTVPHLREAAARYQADLVLAYRTKCRTFEKYKIIDPNETKAYCTVEAVLLDTRSGIVPFTVVSSHEAFVKEVDKDMNFVETMKKAELEAQEKALAEIAQHVKSFLATVPLMLP